MKNKNTEWKDIKKRGGERRGVGRGRGGEWWGVCGLNKKDENSIR